MSAGTRRVEAAFAMIADERVKRRGPRAVSKFHLCVPVRSVEALTYIVPWRYGLRGGSYARPSADLAPRLWDLVSDTECL